MNRPTTPKTTTTTTLRNLTLERYVDELLTTTESTVWPVLVCPRGTFHRSYQEDILAVIPPVGRADTLRIDVAREGLYDMLPEGVFHESPPGGAGIDTAAAVREVEQNRREEQEARRFFLPVEQEFYRQKIALEHQEQAFFQAPRPGSLSGEFLRRLWGLPAELTPLQQQGFLFLAPHLHRLAGRLPEVAHCFALLLPVPVQLTQQYEDPMVPDADFLAPLGEAVLGHDAVLGDTLDDPWPYWRLTLGPIPGEMLLLFLEGGALHRLIGWLAGYLLPAGIDYHTTLEVQPDEQAFCLRDDTPFMGRLGHTTYLR